jgi:hypothetical protein
MIEGGNDDGWIDWPRLRVKANAVLDGKGMRIDRVRAVREVDGGLEVRILGTVEGTLAVTGNRPDGTLEAVEFTGLVRAGRIDWR